MPEPLVEVEDLSVIFRKNHRALTAVDRVSFAIDAGTTVGLVGESGSGKSTTGRAVAGIGPITAGTVRYRGQVLGARGFDRRAFRRQVQLIFQDPFSSLDPRQKVGDAIGEGIENFHLAASAAERRAQVQALLAQVGLPADAANRFPHEFSGGQRQRIGIARALAVQPEFLVLDEPISALDVSIQAQIVNLLRQIQCERHLTYLFIAHDLSMVRYLCDRVLVMSAGRIVEAGATNAVYQDPRHPYTRSLLSAVPHADPIYEHQKVLIPDPHTAPAPDARLVQVAEEHWVLR
ncbi:ATP-binding cassette domain-containing protein [Lacticaseibacillus kribbianus]|uniref:ATP-binding cassette domain-containing protein n=1 Tax=Lacticaseibacillus kribbianus TaxID=2926292 RepID=UPI001CD6DEBB|nr:ATP-binding cassette domain-containing protein [Lacticaseibacillus kribbianus]